MRRTRADRLLEGLRLGLVGASGVALIGMVLMITLDVFLRFAFNAPLPATLEISQLLEPHVVFLPMAFALATGSHVRVTLFIRRLPAGGRKAVEVFAYAVAAIFCGLFTWWGWLHFWASFRINEVMLASVKLYWWTGKLAMPVGLGLMTLECVRQLALAVVRQGPDVEEDV